MRHHMSGFGWLEGISGMLLLLLGIFTLLWPNKALSTFVVVYGLIAVLTWHQGYCILCKSGDIHRIWSDNCSDLRYFKCDGRCVDRDLSGCRQMAVGFIISPWFIAHCISRLSQLGISGS